MFSNRIGTFALIVGVAAAFPSAHAATAGAVFVMTNGADQNEVIAYARGEDGKLQERARYNTEGRGSGGQTDPLQSQGSLTLSPDGTLLYAVNAGSGNISTFRVHGPNLSLASKVSSGGSEPVSIAQFGSLVYVVNAGAAGDLVGFTVDAGGHLKEIPTPRHFSPASTRERRRLRSVLTASIWSWWSGREHHQHLSHQRGRHFGPNRGNPKPRPGSV